MKQLSIVCIVSLLFAVFVPFALSFPSRDESFETYEFAPSDKEISPDASEPTDTQTAPTSPVSEAPSHDTTPGTTSVTSEAPTTAEPRNEEFPPFEQGPEFGIRIQLSCGDLKCPQGSVSCLFTKQTTDDLKFVERNSTCLCGNGGVLFFETDQEPNFGNGPVFITIANSLDDNASNAGDYRRFSNADHFGNSNPFDNSGRFGGANHFRNADHFGNPNQFGSAGRFGGANHFGNADHFGYPNHFGNAGHFGGANQFGNADHFGNPNQFGNAGHFGGANQFGNAGHFGGPNHFRNADHFGNPNHYGNAGHFGSSNNFGNAGHFGGPNHFGNAGGFGTFGSINRKIDENFERVDRMVQDMNMRMRQSFNSRFSR